MILQGGLCWVFMILTIETTIAFIIVTSIVLTVIYYYQSLQ